MVVVLTGGTGGAKLIHGLSLVAPANTFTIICNTADDFTARGLYIAPDLDTVTYTLAGMVDLEKGWGIDRDSFVVLESLARLGGETWFKLGDRDLATHLTRTELLRKGLSLSEATERIRKALGVKADVVPMSDEKVATIISTPDGDISFQEYFVRRRWTDEVIGVRFEGIASATPAPRVLSSIAQADAVIVCPSNPVTSIGPILAVPGMRAALKSTPAKIVAVSPMVRDRAFSGPAHRLMPALNMEPTSYGVAAAYADFIDTMLIAEEDGSMRSRIEQLGVRAVPGRLGMDSMADKERLARFVWECAAMPT